MSNYRGHIVVWEDKEVLFLMRRLFKRNWERLDILNAFMKRYLEDVLSCESRFRVKIKFVFFSEKYFIF